MSDKPSLRAVELRKRGPVLVCRKCLKRMANGDTLRKRLKGGLKQTCADSKKKPARLILTTCFGICPKGAVVAASPATFARKEFLLIGNCSEDAIEQAVTALLDDPLT